MFCKETKAVWANRIVVNQAANHAKKRQLVQQCSVPTFENLAVLIFACEAWEVRLFLVHAIQVNEHSRGLIFVNTFADPFVE